MFSFIWVLSFYSCIFQPLLMNDKSKSQKTNVNINPKNKKRMKNTDKSTAQQMQNDIDNK